MSPQKMAETRLALPLFGFSLLSILSFWREFFVGWALPTTASIAVVKSSILSLLAPCS